MNDLRRAPRPALHAPVVIDARALRAIEAEMLERYLLSGHETGGLLVGPPGTRTVLDFIPSGADAHRSMHSYRTDPEHLQRALDACHARHGGDVLGYAHSHPAGLMMPSMQDLAEADRMIADPDYRSLVDEVLLPIGQVRVDRGPDGDHRVDLHWYVYRRGGDLLEVGARVVPHWAAVEALDAQLREDGFTVEQRVLHRDGLALVARRCDAGFVWVLPPAYPDEPPRLFRLEGDDPIEELDVPEAAWRGAPFEDAGEGSVEDAPPDVPDGFADDGGTLPDDDALADGATGSPPSGRLVATDRAWSRCRIPGEASAVPVYHRDGTLTCVLDADGPARVRIEGTDPLRITGPDGRPLSRVRVPFETDFASRSTGLVDAGHLRRARVLVVGCGSVGSAMADQLVRAGVGGLTLVDPDVVSVANLARSTFELADIDRPKVQAVAEKLLRINPHVEIDPWPEDFMALDDEITDALVEGHEIAVVAVDRPDVVRVANAALHARRPAVYPGVFEMGSGGEVLFTRPGGPCLECVLRETRFETEPPPIAGQWDYSSADGRLKAEPALVAQINHVVSAAVLITLALLSEGTDTEMARLVDPEHSALFLANQRCWIFEYPLQAVWARLERDPDCACAEAADETG